MPAQSLAPINRGKYPENYHSGGYFGAAGVSVYNRYEANATRLDPRRFTILGHAVPDTEPEFIEFPGIEKLYEQFWDEIPKERFGPATDA